MINNIHTPDTRETVSIDISDEDFLRIAKAAHDEDLTLNKFVEKLLIEVLEKFELERDA